MLEKIRTIGWFMARPSFWPHMAALAKRKFDGSAHHENFYGEAEMWASERAVTVRQALITIRVMDKSAKLAPALSQELLSQANDRAKQSGVEMGGPGDLELIYQSILAISALKVIETGVAYGWSSLAALAALRQTGGELTSVDMPYPKANNESFVGIVVPQEWRNKWRLIRAPDRNGILQAIKHFSGSVDLVHYDSDKSYAGRMFALPKLWAAIRPNGLLICDDIQDNFGFRDFCEAQNVPFAITKSDGKYVGLVAKPEK